MSHSPNNPSKPRDPLAAFEAAAPWEHTFHVVPDPMAILDCDHRIVRVNRAMCGRLGLSPQECVGQPCYRLVHGTDAPPSFCPHVKLLRDGKEHSAEVHEENLHGDFLVSVSPLRDATGRLLGSVHIARDITERKLVEDEVRRNNALLESIRSVQSMFIQEDDPKPVFERLLEILVKMTGSEFGFLDEVWEDDDGTRFKVNLAISNIAWNVSSKALYEQFAASSFEFRNLGNLAGAPAKTGKLVIANDAPHDPRSGGLPPGHPAIHSFLGIPLYFGGHLLGVAGVANRPGGYDREMAEFLEPFSATCAGIIHAHRSRKREQQAIEAVRESEALLSAAEEIADIGSYIWTIRSDSLRWSNNMYALAGLDPRSFSGNLSEAIRQVIHPDDLPQVESQISRMIATKTTWPMEFRVVRPDGSRRIWRSRARFLRDNNGVPTKCIGVHHDITEYRQTESERAVTIDLLRLIGAKNCLHELMQSVTLLLQEWSGCEAVGIRLRQGDDFPYFETRGFSPEFVVAENSLCVCDIDDELLRDGDGNPVLECMCGNVLQGRTDPKLPFFTEQGSFWTNSTTDLLASTSEEDRKGRTRNRCHGEGYESVALIPLRSGGETFGLLQFNDPQRGRFSPEMVQLFERLADNLAIGLAQRQAAAALRESERRLRTLMSNLPGMAYRCANAPDWPMEFLSEGCHDLTGYAPEELVGDRLQYAELINPDDREMVWETVQEAIREDRPFEMEYRIRTKDGQEKWVWERGRAVPDGEPARLALEGFMADVTDRKQAEQALRESEQKFRAVFEQAPDSILLIDAETGDIIDFNDRACENLGYTREEFAKLKICDFEALESADEVAAHMQQGLAAGQLAFVSQHRTKNGAVRDVLVQTMAITLNNRPFFVSLWADITDQKRAEQALREREARYRALFGATADAIYVHYVRDDGMPGAISEVNQAAAEMLGYTREELLRMSVTDLDAPESRTDVPDVMEKLQRGEIAQFEQFHVAKDGRRIPVEIRAQSFTFQGREAVFSTVRDISDRKLAEQRLRDAQRLRAEAEKLATAGQMAARIAHEINNPLAGIKNGFRLIRDAVPADHPDRDMVERIEREVDRIAHVVREMYQSYTARKQRTGACRVGEAVADVVSMLEPLCRQHEVTIDRQPVLPELVVQVAEGSLHQLLYNVMANAIEASPPGGTVNISCELADSYVKISIHDQGPGIPAKDQQRLFEPFFTSKRDGSTRGLGLGLWIVKSIADSLAGKIEFTSQSGQGTCFYLYLPASIPK